MSFESCRQNTPIDRPYIFHYATLVTSACTLVLLVLGTFNNFIHTRALLMSCKIVYCILSTALCVMTSFDSHRPQRTQVPSSPRKGREYKDLLFQNAKMEIETTVAFGLDDVM